MHEGDLEPSCEGADGRPIEHITTDDEATAVGKVITRLLGEDDVEVEDIVVLSAHPLARSPLGKVGLTPLWWTP